MIFRIPTPVFGAGLIEQIPDAAILANQAANAARQEPLGIRGRANIVVAAEPSPDRRTRNGNDGTIARFGWKAQNKSLLMFSGEAYNVEMGITNELFQTERDETAQCQFAHRAEQRRPTPPRPTTARRALSAIEKFAVLHALPRAARCRRRTRRAARRRSRAGKTVLRSRLRASATRRR